MTESIEQKQRLTQLAIAQDLESLLPSNMEAAKAADVEEHTTPPHIKWMTIQVQEHFDDPGWSICKLSRWNGIAMGCIVANMFASAQTTQEIVHRAKLSHGEQVDHDMIDHLDEDYPFELDLGSDGG